MKPTKQDRVSSCIPIRTSDNRGATRESAGFRALHSQNPSCMFPWSIPHSIGARSGIRRQLKQRQVLPSEETDARKESMGINAMSCSYIFSLSRRKISRIATTQYGLNAVHAKSLESHPLESHPIGTGYTKKHMRSHTEPRKAGSKNYSRNHPSHKRRRKTTSPWQNIKERLNVLGQQSTVILCTPDFSKWVNIRLQNVSVTLGGMKRIYDNTATHRGGTNQSNLSMYMGETMLQGLGRRRGAAVMSIHRKRSIIS